MKKRIAIVSSYAEECGAAYYSSRLIKHLVGEARINLAGVKRLLSIAESIQRLRPLVSQEAGRTDSRRRIAQELKRISDIIDR